MQQSCLFADEPLLPDGMRYQPDLISPAQEAYLLKSLRPLPFADARYREWTARRRVVGYGGRFDLTRNVLADADPLPAFLQALREQVSGWSGIDASRFSHVLVTEYRPGTPLGWHRDAPCYESIVGISLAATACMRLRPYPPGQQPDPKTLSIELAPRSAYVLKGAARRDWQHAIAPTKALRYSITFRTLAC
jgi:alkylated DNA repair dioxygenase AlkB